MIIFLTFSHLLLITVQIFWQIRAVFQDSAQGFTLVDSSLKQSIQPDQLVVNSASQVTIEQMRPSWSCCTKTILSSTRSCHTTDLETISTTGVYQPSLWATGLPRMEATSSSLLDLSQGSIGRADDTGADGVDDGDNDDGDGEKDCKTFTTKTFTTPDVHHLRRFTKGVVNVWGADCLGGERLTILFNITIIIITIITTICTSVICSTNRTLRQI